MILEENEETLREFILAQLDNDEFLEKLQKQLLKLYKSEAEIENLDQDDLYNVIVKENLIEKIYPDFWQVNPRFAETKDQFGKENLSLFNRFLKLKICQISDLQLEEGFRFVRIGVNMDTSRFLGKRRQIKNAKTPINEIFFINLDHSLESRNLSPILKDRHDLFVYIVAEGKTSSKTKIIGLKFVEWRFVLSHGRFSVDLDFTYINDRVAKISKGNFSIKVNMEISPKLSRSEFLSLKTVEQQLKHEKTKEELRMKQFFEFSKIWWKEYKSLNPVFAERVVKIYGEDCFGIFRPLSVYVKPFVMRDLESIAKIKRFIALLSLKRQQVGALGEKKEKWLTFSYAFFGKEFESNTLACLLCSLLLGLGYNAFVACGMNSKKVHYWVMTFENKFKKIKFWEPSNGLELDKKDPRVHNLYRTIGSLFNHEFLFANIQDKESVS